MSHCDLDPAQPPDLRGEGQLGCRHRGATDAVFADGWVRSLKEAIDPAAFEALATIAGGEQEGRVGDE